jgi:hypothetical protein
MGLATGEIVAQIARIPVPMTLVNQPDERVGGKVRETKREGAADVGAGVPVIFIPLSRP